jgi:hypothetical protein
MDLMDPRPYPYIHCNRLFLSGKTIGELNKGLLLFRRRRAQLPNGNGTSMNEGLDKDSLDRSLDRGGGAVDEFAAFGQDGTVSDSAIAKNAVMSMKDRKKSLMTRLIPGRNAPLGMQKHLPPKRVVQKENGRDSHDPKKWECPMHCRFRTIACRRHS